MVWVNSLLSCCSCSSPFFNTWVSRSAGAEGSSLLDKESAVCFTILLDALSQQLVVWRVQARAHDEALAELMKAGYYKPCSQGEAAQQHAAASSVTAQGVLPNLCCHKALDFVHDMVWFTKRNAQHLLASCLERSSLKYWAAQGSLGGPRKAKTRTFRRKLYDAQVVVGATRTDLKGPLAGQVKLLVEENAALQVLA